MGCVLSEGVIGLVGVVIGALLTPLLIGAKECWVARASRRKNAQYLAVRVVSLLDGFLEKCADVVGDDGLSHNQREPDGLKSPQVSTPQLDFDSLKVDWRSIPPGLMYEVLSLPNRATAANQRIHGIFEYNYDPPDFDEFFEERQIQFGEIGLLAASLADRLRAMYGVPDRDYLLWDPVKFLREGKDLASSKRQQRQQRFAQLAEYRQ